MSQISLAAVVAVLALLCFVTADDDDVRQCKCSEIGGCKDAHKEHFIDCADACKSHAAALGADYPQLKQCFLNQKPKLTATAECVQKKHSNSCANGTPQMLAKRYPESLELAAYSEVDKILLQSGIEKKVRGLLGRAKKMVGCMQNCMRKRSGQCVEKLGCQLALPTDTVVVENVKRCALASGIDSAQLRDTCKCAARAGVRDLNDGICNRLTVA